MPRKPRFNLPGVPQHLIQRGKNRQSCFLADIDYRRYLDDLAEASLKYHVHIHAYVLMTNHVHILATPMVENGLSQLMQRSVEGMCVISRTDISVQARCGKVDTKPV